MCEDIYGARGETTCDSDGTLTRMVNDKFVGHVRQTEQKTWMMSPGKKEKQGDIQNVYMRN